MPLWIYKLGAIALALGIAYGYYWWSQKEILNLELANQAYESAQRQNLATIARQNKEAEDNQKAYNLLDSRLDKAEEYSTSLEKKLQKHNLTRLAIAKPKLIEGIINDATKKKLEDMESYTTKQPVIELPNDSSN